jgi:6 kDa early secretory antigenic target
MDGSMRYDFGAIEGLAGDVNSRVAAVESRLGDLKQKIANLTAMYEGSAAGGFQATRNAWDNAATDLNAVLKRIQIADTHTNDSAQQTERANTNRWPG